MLLSRSSRDYDIVFITASFFSIVFSSSTPPSITHSLLPSNNPVIFSLAEVIHSESFHLPTHHSSLPSVELITREPRLLWISVAPQHATFVLTQVSTRTQLLFCLPLPSMPALLVPHSPRHSFPIFHCHLSPSRYYNTQAHGTNALSITSSASTMFITIILPTHHRSWVLTLRAVNLRFFRDPLVSCSINFGFSALIGNKWKRS